MALIALIIGAVLIVAAIRGTHGELMTAIRQDVPAFAIWAAAIFGVAVIGFIPGLKPVSRGLLALLVVVIILGNYQKLLGAFTGVAYGSSVQAAASGVQVTGYSGGGAVNTGDLLSTISNLAGQIGSGASADYSAALDIPTGTGPSSAQIEAAFQAALTEKRA